VRDFPANLPRGVDDYELEFRMIASDGQSVWFQSIIHVVRYDDKPVIRKGFSIDISARKRIEEALHNLSARLINAQEEERRRIARELHDDFSQRLALMSLDVELLARDQAEPSEAFDEHIHGLLDRIKDLSSDIHRLSHQLHPTTLIHLNLVKAIKSLCDELSALHNLRIDFVDQEVPDSLHDDLTLCLYRIVQEALTNIIKHSGSRKARVELTRSGANLKLCVRDWGVGFDVAKVGNKQGLGLISMRERLHLVNGKMAVESSEARGTQIEVLVPIAEPMPVDGN